MASWPLHKGYPFSEDSPSREKSNWLLQGRGPCPPWWSRRHGVLLREQLSAEGRARMVAASCRGGGGGAGACTAAYLVTAKVSAKCNLLRFRTKSSTSVYPTLSHNQTIHLFLYSHLIVQQLSPFFFPPKKKRDLSIRIDHITIHFSTLGQNLSLLFYFSLLILSTDSPLIKKKGCDYLFIYFYFWSNIYVLIKCILCLYKRVGRPHLKNCDGGRTEDLFLFPEFISPTELTMIDKRHIQIISNKLLNIGWVGDYFQRGKFKYRCLSTIS